MAIKTVSEGMTNSYLIQAFITLLLAAIGLTFNWFIALPLIIFAVALFTSTTGVQIDSLKKQYRKYIGLFGYKIGTWHSLSNVTKITLILSTERTTIRGITPGAIPVGRSSSIQVRTYDLIVNDGIQREEINDFLTYSKAREAYNSLTECLNIGGRDFIAEKLATNRAKKSR